MLSEGTVAIIKQIAPAIRIEQAIAADHEAHASAMRTLEAVRASERETAGLAGMAEADQIPDSQETTLSLDELRRQQSEMASLLNVNP